VTALPPEVTEFIATLRESFLERRQSASSQTSAGYGEPEFVTRAVLSLLARGGSTSEQLVADLELVSAGIQASDVHQELLHLLEQGLVSFDMKDGVKTYDITSQGTERLSELRSASAEAAADSEASNASGRGASALDARRDFAKAGIALTQAVSALATTGKTEQLRSGAASLDRAAKEIFAILGNNK